MLHYITLLLLLFTIAHSRVLPCTPVRWCTISLSEQNKCLDFSKALQEDGTFPFLECVLALDKYDCMLKIERRQADLITLDGPEAYVAGRYHNMIPIMQEKYDNDSTKTPFLYHSTVVIHKDANIHSMKDLKDKKSCHTGVGRTIGWNMPISTLRWKGLINNDNCLNELQSVADFFHKSCAYGAKDPKHNALGTEMNLQSLCDLCNDKEKCDRTDKYGGYSGAFKCLKDGHGDVAFVKEVILDENANVSADFRLLCPDGSHKTFNEYEQCNWGFRPSQAIMTGGNRTKFEKFVMKSMLNFAQQQFDLSSKSTFKLFKSQQYDQKNLLFRDFTLSLINVEEETYTHYLGEAYLRIMESLHPCPNLKARWCVVTQREVDKCQRMRDAFMTRVMRPEIECVQASSFVDCMQMIKDDEADLVALDGGDIYKSGKEYGLIPIAYENYGEEDATYWAVAVAKKGSTVNLLSLKGTKSCHTGISKTAGWNMPIGYLINSKQLSPSCDIIKDVGNFFSKSCVPGVLSDKFNPKRTNPENLCGLCSGVNSSFCKFDQSEPYYSYAGALRCLVEGGGDVAFIKHTTAVQYTDGKKKEDWAKNLLSNDFELLCPDGTRKPITEFKTCNLAKVPSHAVMTSGNRTNYDIDLYLNLLLQAQYYYKNDTNPYFQMFQSDQTPDLIFKDSTIELKAISKNKRQYDKWLGSEYIATYQASNTRSC